MPRPREAERGRGQEGRPKAYDARMPQPERRTKIVATWGPALADPRRLREAIAAGADVIRLNFSHATRDEVGAIVPLIRSIGGELGRHVALLQDIQGPRLRTGPVADEVGVELRAGATVAVTPEDVPSTAERVSVPYPRLAEDVAPGHRILIADGVMRLRVAAVRGAEIEAEVVAGGRLTSHKGVNLPDSRVSADPLTPKDRADLAFGAELGVDFIALSFVRSAADVEACRDYLRSIDGVRPICAKIEHPLAIENLDEILAASDAVMVARGDLGVEVSPERVPLLQKRIVADALQAGLPIITATQMLESMIERPVPTRAEASDIANAILDGTDAVMLSGETAVGAYPVESIATMARIALAAEEAETPAPQRVAGSQPEALAAAACVLAERLRARAMVVVTGSGRTAATLSAHRPVVPIYAFTPSADVCRNLMLRYGVWPTRTDHPDRFQETVRSALTTLRERGAVEPGDRVVFFGTLPAESGMIPNLINIRVVDEG